MRKSLDSGASIDAPMRKQVALETGRWRDFSFELELVTGYSNRPLALVFESEVTWTTTNQTTNKHNPKDTMV